MQWRHQMGALLGAVVLITILVAVRSLAPVTAGDASMRSSQPNFSSQAKTTSKRAISSEIDIPYTGSIESPWDTGSFWDEEAPAYELRAGGAN
jgi:hypothetical protein